MIRINSRITEEQHKLIKKLAKRDYRTEGEILRMILEEYLITNKNKNEQLIRRIRGDRSQD